MKAFASHQKSSSTYRITGISELLNASGASSIGTSILLYPRLDFDDLLRVLRLSHMLRVSLVTMMQITITNFETSSSFLDRLPVPVSF